MIRVLHSDNRRVRVGDHSPIPHDLDALGRKGPPVKSFVDDDLPGIVIIVLLLCVIGCQMILHRGDTARAIAKAKAEEHAQMVYAIKHFYKIDGIQVVAWYQGKKGK